MNKIAVLGIGLLLVGCANKAGGPQGGPKDETPPKVLKETPLNGALNYQKKVIMVEFDENIALEKVAENVLVSPPQVRMPNIQAVNKKLTITLEDDLRDSTTYTLNFGNAIVDNNEKNVFENYIFSFSTGAQIDTLQMSGIVLDAENLNPVSGVLTGVYPAQSPLHDSVFQTTPFLRVGRTDSRGNFTITNIHEGTYALYGLSDNSHDYRFQLGEGLAMYDTLLSPYSRMEEVRDTVWADSVTVDSVRRLVKPIYYPNNLILKHFKENKKRQYLMKSERPKPNFFQVYFGAPADSLPILKSLDSDWSAAVKLQSNATHDTLTYWLTDSLLINNDTLQFALTYQKTDSVFDLYWQTDTLRAVYRRPRITAKGKTVSEKSKVEFMNLTSNAKSPFEIYNTVNVRADVPVAQYDVHKMRLLQWQDTLSRELPLQFAATDDIGMAFEVSYAWQAEEKYELQIDSAAMVDIYGKNNKRFAEKFTIRSLDAYSKIIVLLEPFNEQAVIQILDTKDKPVRTLPAQKNGTEFNYLSPGDYYLRLFVDANGDGKWTTGDYVRHRQPEEVFYYPNKLTLRANWDFEEMWNYTATPLLQQKPKELQQSDAPAANGHTRKL